MIRIASRLFAALIAFVLLATFAHAQSRPYKFLSAVSTNATLVKGGQSLVFTISAVNTTTTLYYLKLYDKGTTPTCNTDPVVFMTPLPASATGGSIVIPFPTGLIFDLGVGFCITAGSADSDNANAATGVTVGFAVK